MADTGATPRDDPDIQGRLGSLTLTDILQLLGGAGQTGTLELTQGWNGRTISYEDGQICYVSAVTRIPDAAELLLAAGRLDQARYQIVRAEADRHPERAVEGILTDMRLANEEDLEQCHNQQIEDLLYTFFLWRSCRFAFWSGPPERAGGMPIDLSTEHLILEGVRLVDEWIAISPVVPSVRMVFRKVGVWPGEQLDVGIADVYREVNGVNDVASIARLCGITQYACAKALYELGTAGLIEAQPPNKIKTIELFNILIEGVYTKLELFGHHGAAVEFMQQLNNYSRQHGLKVRMRGGKIDLADFDLPIEPAELIDLYRTFLAVQTNKFERMFDQTVVRGLVSGSYAHLRPDLRALMGVYDFVPIEGLFDGLRASHAGDMSHARIDRLVSARR